MFAPWDLETEAAFRAAALASCRDGRETWVVAPFSLAACYPYWVPTTALDWADLAAKLEQRLHLPHRAPASGLAWTAAMVRALRTILLPTAFQPAVAQDAVGVARALSHSLQALFEQAPDLATIPAGGAFVRSNLGLLLALKAHVAQDLAAQQLANGPMRWMAIAEALRAGPCDGLPARLIIDGVDTLDHARAEAIAALAAQDVEIQAPPWLRLPELTSVTLTGPSPPTTPAAIVRHHRDVHEEALGALTWVREHLQAGAEVGDLAIMVPPGAGYDALLHDTFARADFAISVPYQPAVTGLREIQALRAYASLRSGPLDVVDLVTLLAASEVITGPELLRLADRLYDELPAELPPIEALADLAAPPRGLREELANFWERWIANPDEQLKQACDAVLETSLALHGPTSLADWPARLEALLEVPAKPLRPAPDAIAVLHAGPYAPTPLKHLLVLGFCDGTFPGTIQPLPLLGASEIAALATAGVAVPTPVERASWEMRNVWRMLGITSDVTLSVPERALTGDALRPSPVLEQLTHLQPPPPGQGPLSRPELQLASARALATSTEPLPGVGAWAAGVFREAPSFQLDPAVITRRLKHLSPSSIDWLLSCPFSFYAKALLSLENRPVARALGWDAALEGNLGHKVLEVMLTDQPDHAVRPDAVGPTLKRVLAEHFPALQAAAYRIQLELLRRNLEAFVTRYAELAASLGATGGHSEWKFKLDLPLPGRAQPIPVKGSIDRVLLRAGRPVAIDFKSGDVAKYRAQRAVGLGAQVAIYAWAIEQAGLGQPAAFAYLTLGGRKVEVQAIAARNASILEGDDPEPLEDFQARLQAGLATQLAALEAGSIAPVTPERAAELEEAKAHPCRYCELELLCQSRR